MFIFTKHPQESADQVICSHFRHKLHELLLESLFSGIVLLDQLFVHLLYATNWTHSTGTGCYNYFQLGVHFILTCNFHHFEMTSHKLHIDMLRVRQVCKQCGTHAELDSGSLLTAETNYRRHSVHFTPDSCFFQRGSLFARKISSAQFRNPPRCPSMRHARAHVRTQRAIYSHGADPLISSLRRVTVYVTYVKTTSMDDARTLHWHTPMYNTWSNVRVRIRARAYARVAARYCISICLHTQTHTDTRTQHVSTVKVAELHVRAF